jgi:hypothetical protein
MNVSPSQDNVFSLLQPFVANVTGLDPSLVLKGIQNRDSLPPADPGFVIATAVYQRRLRTNVDTWDTTNPAPNAMQLEQGTELRVQLDCYGAASGDWAAMLSTVLRDEVGCLALAPYSQPLYVDDAKMAPLVDSEAQYEQRWTLDAVLQYNPVTTAPQQFMTAVNVDEAYPP